MRQTYISWIEGNDIGRCTLAKHINTTLHGAKIQASKTWYIAHPHHKLMLAIDDYRDMQTWEKPMRGKWSISGQYS